MSQYHPCEDRHKWSRVHGSNTLTLHLSRERKAPKKEPASNTRVIGYTRSSYHPSSMPSMRQMTKDSTVELPCATRDTTMTSHNTTVVDCLLLFSLTCQLATLSSRVVADLLHCYCYHHGHHHHRCHTKLVVIMCHGKVKSTVLVACVLGVCCHLNYCCHESCCCP